MENVRFLLRVLSSWGLGEPLGSNMFLVGGPGIVVSILSWVGVEKGQGGSSNIGGGILGGWILGCAAGAAWFRAFRNVLGVTGGSLGRRALCLWGNWAG